MRVFYLPMGASLRSATSLLRQDRFGNGDFIEPGSPVSVRCRHTGWLGLFGIADACTVRYATGGSWSCSVAGPADYVGLSASCDGPVRDFLWLPHKERSRAPEPGRESAQIGRFLDQPPMNRAQRRRLVADGCVLVTIPALRGPADNRFWRAERLCG
jgi:hypothetical protein